MRCFAKTVGVAALTFGVGIIMCALLPPGMLACVEAVIIVGAGVALYIK